MSFCLCKRIEAKGPPSKPGFSREAHGKQIQTWLLVICYINKMHPLNLLVFCRNKL